MKKTLKAIRKLFHWKKSLWKGYSFDANGVPYVDYGSKSPRRRWLQKMNAIVKLHVNKERRKGELPMLKMQVDVSTK